MHCGVETFYLTLSLPDCSNGGKVLNFKIVDNVGVEFYISPRWKFPSVSALLEAYKTTPIKSKRSASARVFLLHPIPVDPVMEHKHRMMLERKGKGYG